MGTERKKVRGGLWYCVTEPWEGDLYRREGGTELTDHQIAVQPNKFERKNLFGPIHVSQLPSAPFGSLEQGKGTVGLGGEGS